MNAIKIKVLLAILLLVGMQQAKADSNQPRVLLPDLTSDEKSIDLPSVYASSPHFTIYLWVKNSDDLDSYWNEAPYLNVDGHSVRLSHLHGTSVDYTESYDYVCHERTYGEENVYFYVHTRKGFKAGDNDKFKTLYGSKLGTHYKSDYYIPIDIFMHENRAGEKHEVYVRGKATLDRGTTDYFFARDENGDSLLVTLPTHSPYSKLGRDDTTLKWTNPRKLTFTSDKFDDCKWGNYQVVLDGQASEKMESGKITVTKNYGDNTNYRDTTSKAVEYRYEGVFNPNSKEERNDDPGTVTINTMIKDAKNGVVIWPNSSIDYFIADSHCHTLFCFSSKSILKDNGWETMAASTLTLTCLDKKIRRVEVKSGMKSLGTWTGDDWSCVVDIENACTITQVVITYDRGVNGYPIIFTDTYEKAPETLSYPTNLTAQYDAWGKSITTTWGVGNDNDENSKGTYYVYRDTAKVDSVTSGNPLQYKDKKVNYDQNYQYTVYFRPTGWSRESLDPLLSVSTTATLTRTVSLSDLQVETLSNGYKLSWSIQPEFDKMGYKFLIYRRTVTASEGNLSPADFEGMEPLKTIEVLNQKTTNYTYIDEVVSSTATYAYMVAIMGLQDCDYYTMPVITDGHPDASHIKSLYASRGTYTDHVHLTWEEAILGQDKLVYTLYRHKIEEGENEVSTLAQAQELKWDKIATLESSSASPVNSYDDKTAVGGYYYIYAMVACPNGSDEVFSRKISDGFVRSTGNVYGSVTYENGKFAVQGVKVTLQTSATTNTQVFNSLSLKGGNGGVHWNITPEKMSSYFAGPYSVQMYVRPNGAQTSGACLLDMGGQLRLTLGDYDESKGGYPVAVNGSLSNRYIKADRFSHLTFTYNGSDQAVLYTIDPDQLDSIASQDFAGSFSPVGGNGIAVAATTDCLLTLNGYVDEVRFFKHQLTVKDVQQNFSHYLGGAESGLVAYWPFDESISTMRLAYDNSKTSGTANENHATIVGGRRSNVEVPSQDQLSLYAVTDTIGSYTLRGIPYAEEGTTYSLVPTKGAHKFNPTARTIYVSPSSLTFDPQNFTDQSSFNVKGVVYYENTTYPVKGCRFRVDDTVVKDEWGNEILSDENGEYTIPVSIGQHAIYVEKDGHTFLNGGRYPAEGLFNFNDSISHLTFTDQTKAVVVGRVAGGAVEKGKPLALGLGKANIGAATLTLLTSTSMEDARRMNVTLNSEEGIYDDNKKRHYYEQANPDYVQSEAWVGGTDDGADGVKCITIKTDSLTGEFAVKLPPVPYYIYTKVDKNPEASASFDEKVLLDCSNVVNVQTATSDDLSFNYNTALVQTYFAVPEISVVQTDNTDGAFGDARVPAGELNDTVDTWQKKDGQLVYNYGYPIFTSCKYYTFEISSFERYINYDGELPQEDRQPSSEGYLTFKNPMDLTADTLAEVPLDTAGCYQYTFQALEPNVVDPYIQPIDIELSIGDNVYLWNWQNGDYKGALQGVVFGAKATGETNVAAAPDILVNILRDPFGSNSNLVWNSGSSRQKGFDAKISGKVSGGTNNVVGSKVGETFAVGAPGFYELDKVEFGYKVGFGLIGGVSLNANGGATWEWSNSKEYQTSTEPTFDGPAADLFIGATSSLVYGDGLQVKLVNDQAGGFRIGTQEVIATGQRMNTDFAYTQDYIVNQLIPDYKRLREARLVQVSEAELESRRSSFRNETDSIIYMTSLTPDDPRFGTNNNDSIAWGDKAVELEELSWTADSLCCYGPSYSIFLPANGNYKDVEEMWDAIVTINSNIQLWEYYLALNERGKVLAFHKSPIETQSFDSGSAITINHEEALNTDGSGTLGISGNIYLKLLYQFNSKLGLAQMGVSGNIFGKFEFELEGTLKGGTGKTDSYTINLNDPIADNFHQIEIYGATEGYGGIDNDGRDDFGGYCFFQRSGQTSQYYEGEERTKFYQPGQHILSNATVQVEVPHIECAQPVVTGVPAGQPAVFDLQLTNATQANITRYINFDLMVIKDKWSQMAEVSINGQPGINVYPVSLAPGEVATVKMKVMPASSEVIHIDSLHLCFYSDNEDELGDDIYLTAHFQPQTEAVTLKASRTLVNTSTDSTLVLTATGYNYNSSILNGVRLQQRKVGAPDWTTIHSWVKGTPAGDTESALPVERIDTIVDMHSSIFYPDATYEFRAVTDCTVAGETALGESDIITVIKDVTLPQPIQLPEPADGVLGEGDNISITFNEDIRSSSLNEVDNFVIQSVLNTDSVAHDVALRLDGASIPAASSQSQLVLGGTSFTLCGWVKSGNTAGTLFRHGEGQNSLRVDIDAAGWLTVYIKDENGVAQPYKSTKTLPKDIWSYVAVVYNIVEGNLSAFYASGDNEATLMDAVPVGKYATSEGTIYLGEGLTGAMHELSLFSEPLTWTTIKAQMYYGKSHSTPAIIGYWRLDEGHGTKSEDRARSRHMNLASENGWYLENANLSMGLDGTHCAAIPMGTLSVNNGVSYLVEMWALADENQNANAQLMSLDNGQKLDLNIVDGQLQLVADSVAYSSEPSTSNITDHQWHHVALNVLKGSGGQANLLVDGVSVLTVSADKVPALSGARLWLGRNMKGMIDEVRLWHGTNTQETITERMYYRLDGSKEQGLVGYYPMENTHYDEYNQRVFVFSLENKGYQATASTTLVTDAEGVELSEGSDAPGLKVAPHKSNLDFSFVADERTVSVTLDHSAKSLEGCTVSTTLRDYYDMNTNVGTPITWSFVVKQNPLTWNTSEVNVSAKAGWDEDVTATLTNNGDEDQQWSFTELPSWLIASPSSGTIFAHGSQEVTFTVLPGNAIGKYFATVSARGNKELDTPLDICLTVKGNSPNWEREMTGESMTVTGQIKINGVISTDPDDMIGAFTDPDGESLGRCIGVGHPTYNASKDAYYVTMLIVADTSVVKVNDIIRFRIYDASTGKVYPLTNVYDEVYFKPDAVVGNLSNPVIWENRDKLLQTFELNQGANYISLYLKPVRQKLSELFSSVTKQIKSVQMYDGATFTYNSSDGEWSDEREGIDAGQMMIVQMNSDAELFVVGDAVNPEDYPITVKPGVNCIGVPSSSYMSLEEAFAGLNPQDGDQVKDLSGVSFYWAGEWSGDIGSIAPGKGYKYTSMDGIDKTFTFPVKEASSGGGVRSGNYGIAANYKYLHNMTAICTVHDEYGQPMEVKSLMAYDTSGELRGRATRSCCDSLYVMVISGDVEDEPIVIVPSFSPQTSDTPQSYATLVHFKSDDTLGSFRSPLVLQKASSTGIDGIFCDPNSQLTIYNTQGLTVYRGMAGDFNRQQLHLDGIYIVNEVMPDGRTRCYKYEFMKK